MKRALILSIFLSSWLHVPAQDADLDSIRQQLGIHQEPDTLRVQLLISLTKYYTTRDISESLGLIEEALEISKTINYPTGMGVSLSALGTYYVLKGELDKALSAALRSREILDSIQDYSNLINTNNVLARIYNVTEKSEKALEMHLSNLTLVQNMPASSYKAGFYFYVAKSYEGLLDYQQAKSYYLKALEISSSVGYQTGIAIAEGSLGNLSNHLGEYKTAIAYLQKTLAFSESYQQQSNIAASNSSLAVSYKGLGEYQTGLKYNAKAIEIYEEMDNYRMLKEAYRHHYDLYERAGDLNSAMQFLKKFYAVSDTLLSETKLKLIEELQTKYETEKKEAEITALSQQAAIQELKLARRNQTIIIGLVGFALILIVVYLVYKDRALRKDRKQAELEHRFLRSQLNPHFIFNALLAIQNFMFKNDGKVAALYLTKFSNLMRQILESSRQEFIPVEEELEMLRNFMDIHQLRLQNSFDYTIDIGEDIDPETDTIPPMFVQPFVENAIEHGIVNAKGKGLISLSLKKGGEYITIEVKDNGGGLSNSSSNPKAHNSLATKIIRERMELFNKSLKDQIQLILGEIRNEQGEIMGTRVELKVPFSYI